MRSCLPALVFVGLVALIAIAAGSSPHAWAQEEAERAARREVELPFRHLRPAPGVIVTEGVRGMRDAFPYLAVSHETATEGDRTALAPARLGVLLASEPAAAGEAPAAVRTPQAALEAVRVFVAGPLVRTEAEGARVLATGRALARELKYLRVEVGETRPPIWAPVATAIPQADGLRRTEAWAVTLVAFEVDRVLRLVHVEARVTADGAVSLTRTPLVEGPATIWQSAVTEARTEAEEGREKAMLDEVITARRRYAKALGQSRESWDVWTLARLVFDTGVLGQFLGEPDHVVGSGLRMPTFALDDGTFALFAAAPTRIVYAKRIHAVDSAMRWGPVLETWFQAGR